MFIAGLIIGAMVGSIVTMIVMCCLSIASDIKDNKK